MAKSASSFAAPRRVTSRSSDTDFTSSHFAWLTSSSPHASGSSSTCEGSRRQVVVQGTTITTPARLSLSGSGGDHDRRPTPGLLASDGFAEIHEPDVAATGSHAERSDNEPLSAARSTSIASHASASCRSSA